MFFKVNVNILIYILRFYDEIIRSYEYKIKNFEIKMQLVVCSVMNSVTGCLDILVLVF
jgi:hypothetical protein